MTGIPPEPPAIILDTNVLLDWRVFKDPIVAPVIQAIAQGQIRWLYCGSMQREWQHVWPRACFARWEPDPQMTEPAFALGVQVDEPPRGPLRCSDPDDQVFIDLALSHQAHWLLTKDRALLKLKSRAQRLGCVVGRPEVWSKQNLLRPTPSMAAPAA